MKKSIHLTTLFLGLLLGCLNPPAAAFAQAGTTIPTPEEHFGFVPGTDRMLFDYENLIQYFQKLDEASDRLQLFEFGRSPMDKPMYVAFISTPNNIRNLIVLRESNRRLALDPDIPDSEREVLIRDARVFVMITLSMHSTEIGPSQAAPIIAHELVTTADPRTLSQMEDVVFMLVPCHNPDGMDMVVEHYKKYKDTRYEGCGMPGIYHKYTGHDNNRDFITLSQADNRAISKLFSTEWFPQILIEKHQMGSGSARYYVPPSHDPIAENIDAGLWNWTGIIGSNIINDMTAAGLAGVSRNYLFDDYWPGSTTTCIWKNVTGLLTECAGVNIASPVFIEPNELRGYGKGLSEYKKSINMPLPWPGGWWRLSNIVEYERASLLSLLKTASLYRESILKFRNDLCVREVAKGRTEAPIYFILPLKQHDQSELVPVVNLLREHGVDVYHLTSPYRLGEFEYQKGDIVIPLAQPYRAFIKEVMEKQIFPVRHYTPGGEIIQPYDITSWSLPLHRSLHCQTVNIRSGEFENLLQKLELDFRLQRKIPAKIDAALFTINNNESYKAAFLAMKSGLDVYRLEESLIIDQKRIPEKSFLIYSDRKKPAKMEQLLEQMVVAPIFLSEKTDIKKSILAVPRIGLVESYFHDLDAGWTRYILDSYSLPYRIIRPGELRITNLNKDYDMIIFPDQYHDVLRSGKYKSNDQYYLSNYPPEYTKGIEKEGMNNLMKFIDDGGTIISWGNSTGLFTALQELKHGKDETEEFQLPIQDISEKLKTEGLFCPGSLLNVELRKDHPLTLGMPTSCGVFFRNGPLFATSIPNFDMDRRVIVRFPERDILLSGYCENVEKLADVTVGAWLKKGNGQLVLFGFNPIFRASTQATFKLLFNAILLPRVAA